MRKIRQFVCRRAVLMTFIAIMFPCIALCEMAPAGKQGTLKIDLSGINIESILEKRDELIKKIQEQRSGSTPTSADSAFDGNSSWQNEYFLKGIHHLVLGQGNSSVENQNPANMADPNPSSDSRNDGDEPVLKKAHGLIFRGQGEKPLQEILSDGNAGNDSAEISEPGSVLKTGRAAKEELEQIDPGLSAAGMLKAASSMSDYTRRIAASLEAASGLGDEWASSQKTDASKSEIPRIIANETMEQKSRTASDEDGKEAADKPSEYAIPLYRKEYNGMGLVRLDEFSIISYGWNNMVLQALITNVSDREMVFHIQNIYLNGRLVDESWELYGSGENGGLLPQEKATVTIPIRSAADYNTNSNYEVTFEISALDASHEEQVLGKIPVRCKK